MLDPVGGVGAGFAAGAAIGASMSAFAASAASGGFAVNETGGQALLKAIGDMKAALGDIRVDLQVAEVLPPLGQSHGAQVMTTVDAAVAGDDQGFLPMLDRFVESLNAAEQGINDAMRNYAAMDADGAGRLRPA